MRSIKELRQKKGITQRELASLIGVQPSMISRYEAGKAIPTFQKMKALAEVFEVDAQDFIFSDEKGEEFLIESRHPQKIPDFDWYRRLLIAVNQGKCELCKSPAPFIDKDGKPYLQLFEIDKAFVGNDYSKNFVALCPNCFQRVSVLEDKDELEQIRSIAKQHSF
ncbi:MAG: helix-turn-helix domain-containing protein [Clostridiales bacterium]|nr:helix-turn-helix domain-containing protein [Clostridiales bacterium]